MKLEKILPMIVTVVVLSYILYSYNSDENQKKVKQENSGLLANLALVEKLKSLCESTTRENRMKNDQKINLINHNIYAVWNGYYCGSDILNFDALNEELIRSGYHTNSTKDSIDYILLSCFNRLKVGEYTNGGPAYQLNSSIKLYNLKSGDVFYICDILGKKPPHKTTDENGSLSIIPAKQILDSIENYTSK